MKTRVIEVLKKNSGEFVSGQLLSEQLQVSRTSICKYINALKEDGYDIESISRRGHRLIDCPDILTREEIAEYLHTRMIGKTICYFDQIGSTNKKAKEIAAAGDGHGTVVISEEQTEGRGRLGRNWSSPKRKGIWMSILVRPDIIPTDATKMTQITAASIYKALSDMKIETQIKWPNDIILNEKKVCGILTEMSSEMMQINYMVIGIGINVNQNQEDIPDDIREKATSLKIETGKDVDRKELVGRILNHFEYFYDDFVIRGDISEALEICTDKSILIGKKIRVIKKQETLEREAIGLTEEGELVVKDEHGNTSVVVSGEVSVRGEHGYV